MNPALAAVILTARLLLFFGFAGFRFWLLLCDWAHALSLRSRRRLS